MSLDRKISISISISMEEYLKHQSKWATHFKHQGMSFSAYIEWMLRLAYARLLELEEQDKELKKQKEALEGKE